MLSQRERDLRIQIRNITRKHHDKDTTTFAEIQKDIYQKTGVMAIQHFNIEELTYMYFRLPKTTRQMLRMCDRDNPRLLTMYDLRHSLISTQGADAAMKMVQAERVSDIAFHMIKSRRTPSQKIRILEIGSGLSDVSLMVQFLLINKLQPFLTMDLINASYEIVDVEYEKNTMEYACQCIKGNIKVVRGDATDLSMFSENSFDIGFSSLMLGAFSPPEKAGRVLDEMRRVVRPNGKVVHADFVYLYGKRDTPWNRNLAHKQQDPDKLYKFIPFRMDSIYRPLSGMKGLVKADHHVRQKNIPDFFHELNYKITTSEFTYWSWFDAGDYAAWYISSRKMEYSHVKEERFCGSVPSIIKALYALWKLRDWKELDQEELDTILSQCKQAGTAFNMTTATIVK